MRRKVAIAGLICLAVAIAAWLAWHGLSSIEESAASLSTGSDERSHANQKGLLTQFRQKAMMSG